MEQTTKSVEREVAYSSRYSLSTLFYVTAVIAAAIALLGVGGVGWAVLVLLFWITLIREPRIVVACCLVAISIIGMMIVLAISQIDLYPEDVTRSSCLRRTKQICLAIENYHLANGHYPPAYIADANGKPMHSWRILILPYLEEQTLFEQYDFDEPWNGPNNSKLANMPYNPFAMSPFAEKSKLTCFKLVTGPETAFVEDQFKSKNDITTGMSNVIMLVDDPAKPINWMSPEDVTIEEATQLFGSENVTPRWVYESIFRIDRYHFNNIGRFDASVETTGFLKAPSIMRQYFTIATAPTTVYDDLVFKSSYSRRIYKLGGYLLVAINYCLAVLPIFWMREKT